MDHISFFVSSTFKDMQGERDALHRVVIPEIREFAEAYGRSLDFVDLRWGISTDNLEGDVSTNKILSICLDEIEDCSPYQIVILGERYGWMPTPQQLSETAKQKDFVLENNKISVTELEIQYGMWINSGRMDHCIFCMREPMDPAMLSEEEQKLYLAENEEDRLRMAALKEKIRNTPDVHVISYSVNFRKQSGIYEEFTEKLSLRLHEILEKEWGAKKEKSWFERETEEEVLMTEQLATRFSAREDLVQELEAHTDCGLVVVRGDNGCGMSSLMAKLGTSLREKGAQVKNIYCGNGFCYDTEQLLKILCAHLAGQESEEEFQKIQPDYGEKDVWKQKWDKLASNYTGDKIYFIIDGIHHLYMDEALEKSEFLPSKGCKENLSFVITTNHEVELYPLAVEGMKRWCDFYNVPYCTQQDLRKIITSRLKAEHKQIGESVMKALLAHPLIDNMLCMELILQDILNLDHVDFAEIHKLEQTMDGNEAISTYLCDVIRKHPKKEADLINHWIYRAMSVLAEHETDELHHLYYMMSCLALAMNGLSVNELSDMADYIRNSGRTKAKYWLNWWEEIRFAKLRRYLGRMLRKTTEGRYVFAHEQIRAALFANDTIPGLVAGPMVYFASLPDDSELKQENLLPSFLIYMADKKEGDQECYFFSHIRKVYELRESQNAEESKEGKRRMNRMLHGIRKCLLYGNGELRVEQLGLMLKQKSTEGMTTLDKPIKFFVREFPSVINRNSLYEKSILLSIYIALAKGYEEWEGLDTRYPKPEVKRRGSEMGRYKEWESVERRGLGMIYTEACWEYHALRVHISSDSRLIKPEWDWGELRKKTAHYLNVFAGNVDILRNYYCSKITLMDAEVSLIGNPGEAYNDLKLSEDYSASLVRNRYVDPDAEKDIIWRYMNTALEAVNLYLALASCVEGKQKDRIVRNLRFIAMENCEKTIKRLKKRKFLKDPLDLEPDIRVKYFSTLYYAYFYWKQDKQAQVDLMWDMQKVFRNQEEWMQDKWIRNEILKNAMHLMECLLQGYVPSEYQSDGKTKSSYALRLIDKEASYMLALGQAQNTPKNMYMYYLIRALFIIECQERTPEDAKRELKGSQTCLQEFVDQWKEESGEYIYKLQWLLQWHKDYEI